MTLASECWANFHFLLKLNWQIYCAASAFKFKVANSNSFKQFGYCLTAVCAPQQSAGSVGKVETWELLLKKIKWTLLVIHKKRPKLMLQTLPMSKFSCTFRTFHVMCSYLDPVMLWLYGLKCSNVFLGAAKQQVMWWCGWELLFFIIRLSLCSIHFFFIF